MIEWSWTVASMLEFLRATYLIDITIQLTLIFTYFSFNFYQIHINLRIFSKWSMSIKIVLRNFEKSSKSSQKMKTCPLLNLPLHQFFGCFIIPKVQFPVPDLSLTFYMRTTIIYGCVAVPWHFKFYILKCKNFLIYPGNQSKTFTF